jgi:hypothetical protein
MVAKQLAISKHAVDQINRRTIEDDHINRSA